MSVTARAVKSVKKLPKKLKKLPTALLQLPRKLLKSLKKGGGKLSGVGDLFQILPWNTLSGKVFIVLEAFVFLNVIAGAVYLTAIFQQSPDLLALGEQLLAYTIPGYLVVGPVFLVVYLLDVAGLIRQLVVRSGIRRRNRLSTRMVSLVVGLVTAAAGALLVWNEILLTGDVGIPSVLGEPLTKSLVTFLGTFVVATSVLHWFSVKKNARYLTDDLSVVEVRHYDGEDTQSVVVRNDGEETVTIRDAKLEDSTGERYALNDSVEVRPGETAVLNLPPEFKLEVSEYEVPTGFGMLYDEERATRMYARTGETFELEWRGETET